jgi:hypothetical protein
MRRECFQNRVVIRSRSQDEEVPSRRSLGHQSSTREKHKVLVGNDVGSILVDNGSSADIMTYELFKRMEFRDD